MAVASPRFTEFTQVGSVTLGPGSDLVTVGAYSLADGADTLWVRVTQTSPSSGNNFAYGILAWRSTEGRSLGSIKVYGSTDGEVFQLPVSRAPNIRDGELIFMPRLYNLKWMRDNGPTWSLSFEAVSGSLSSGPSNDLGNAVASVVADAAGELLRFKLQASGLAILAATN